MITLNTVALNQDQQLTYLTAFNLISRLKDNFLLSRTKNKTHSQWTNEPIDGIYFVTKFILFVFLFSNSWINELTWKLIYLQGVKIKMDDAGNILIRRYAKSNVYVKSTAANANEETAIGTDILKLPNSALESEKIVKVRFERTKCELFI